jgi:glycosyltransferase involved in cell wall biosynthesis
LEAYNKIKSDLDIELHVAFGDEELIHHEGVKVFSFKGDFELANFYRSLDIYISAGTYQLGAVHYPVIEAMACGVPVITTGYFPSSNENAWIIKKENSDEIVSKIKNVLLNKDEAICKSQRALCDVQQFDWGTVSNKMIDIFKNS